MKSQLEELADRYLDEIQPGENNKNYQRIEMEDYQESINTVVNLLEAISLMSDSNRTVRGTETNTLYTIGNVAELCIKLMPVGAGEFIDEFLTAARNKTLRCPF